MTAIDAQNTISRGELTQEIAEAAVLKKLRLKGNRFLPPDFECLLRYLTQINKLEYMQVSKSCLTPDQVTKLLIKADSNLMKGLKLHDEHGNSFGSIYTDWERYNQEKKRVSYLHETTKKALFILRNNPPEHIIEFGASTGQETVILMTKCRFLTAIDGDKGAMMDLKLRIAQLNKPNMAKLITYQGQFTLFKPTLLADLFLSNFTWPYRPSSDFSECWKKSVRCVKPGALMAGTLFDQPAVPDPGLTYHTESEVKSMLKLEFELLFFKVEEAGARRIYGGTTPAWSKLYHFVARKKIST